jgi:hypothetical protein
MSLRGNRAKDLLIAAERFRAFACETGNESYRVKFRLSATELELEALGLAASNVVARALRSVRRTSLHMDLPC